MWLKRLKTEFVNEYLVALPSVGKTIYERVYESPSVLYLARLNELYFSQLGLFPC